MAYVAPTITGSGATWAQLTQNGLAGHIELLIGANTFTAAQKSILREIKNGFAHLAMRRYSDAIRDYTRGDPVPQASTLQIITDFNVVFAALSTLCDEDGVLVTANAGTLTTKPGGAGMQVPYRTFS